MLQPNGQRILEILGKHSAAEPSTQGILLPEQMLQALAALEAAISHEDSARRDAIAQAKLEKLPPPRFEPVSLSQRALPFMDMIRVCQKADAAITWGV
jgi:hypothetical protein